MDPSSPLPIPTTGRSLDHKPTPAELAHHAKDKARDVGYDYAAQFLLLIDENKAASVLSSLNNEEVIEICRTISRLREIDAGNARHIIQAFGIPASSIQMKARGGPEAARRLLTTAFESQRAHQLINQLLDPKSSLR